MTRRALQFTALAFAVSWAIALAYYLAGGRIGTTSSSLMLIAYMFGPAIAAVLVQRFVVGDTVRPLGLKLGLNRYWVLAWLFPLAAVFGAMGLSLLLPEVTFSGEMKGFFDQLQKALPPDQFAQAKEKLDALPIHLFWLSLLQAFLAGSTINAVAAFGEELGWRGLLYKETAGAGFWRGSLLVGVLWGLWHAPIILQGYNFPQHPVAGVFLFTLFTVGLSPLLGLVRLRTGSVLAASVSHGFINAIATLPPLVILGGDDLTSGVAGFPMLAVLALLNVALFVWTRVKPELLAPEPDQAPPAAHRLRS